MPTLAAISSRKILEDCIYRLKRVRKGCGKDDDKDERQSTGDPFLDRVIIFSEKLIECRDAVEARLNAPKKSSNVDYGIKESQRARRAIFEVEQELKTLEQFVIESERYYETTRVKKKRQKKIDKRKAIWEARLLKFNECANTFLAIRAMNDQREGLVEQIVSKKQEHTSRTRMRSALGALNRANSQIPDGGGAVLANQRAQYRNTDSSASASAVPNSEPFGYEMEDLRSAPETRQQMMVIDEQKRRVDAGLERISKGLGRLKEVSLAIGAELDVQQAMIDETTARVDEQQSRLKKVTKQVDKVIKEQSKLNCCLNVFCFCLLLALIGYLLWRFGVIPS